MRALSPEAEITPSPTASSPILLKPPGVSTSASSGWALPLPTSPIRSRCIGRPAARSESIPSIAARWSPVSSNGSDSSHGSTSSPRASSGAALRLPPCARRRPATASCSRNSSSKASLCRAPSTSLFGVGEVGGGQRGGPVRQLLGHSQRAGQRLRHVAQQRVVLPRELAQRVRGDPVGGRVHRHEADRVHGRGSLAHQLVGGDPELVAVLHLAVEQHLRALAHLRRHPGLVEPHRHRRPGLVEDARVHALAAAVAHRLHADRADRHGDRRLLPHAHRRYRTRVAAVLVGVREVLEQVAVGLDAERREPLGRLALGLERRGEQARPRVGADAAPSAAPGQLVLGGEDGEDGASMGTKADGWRARRSRARSRRRDGAMNIRGRAWMPADLFGAEEPPPRRLAAVVELELGAVGQRRLDLALIQGCAARPRCR